MTDSDNYTDGSERLSRVEDHLHGILSELDAKEMESEDRIRVESACMQIHTSFGGKHPNDIYRDLQADTNRDARGDSS